MGFIDPFLFTAVQSDLVRLTYMMIICQYRNPGRGNRVSEKYSIGVVEDDSQFCLRIMPTVHMSISELHATQNRWMNVPDARPVQRIAWRLAVLWGTPTLPPSIPHQDLTVRSHQPCRHSPIACPKTSFESNKTQLRPSSFNHTLPLRRPGQHLCTRGNENLPPATSGSVLPYLTALIDALLSYSTRETAPKHSARPLAYDDTLRPLDHPPPPSPRCLLSTALRRRSLRSLLQLRGPMRRQHNGYVNVAFCAVSCRVCPVLFSTVPILCLYYCPEKTPVFQKGSLSTPSSPRLTCMTDCWEPGSNPALLSAEISTHRSLRYILSLNFKLMSWVKQFLKNANYRLDLAADT